MEFQRYFYFLSWLQGKERHKLLMQMFWICFFFVFLLRKQIKNGL